MASNPSTTEPQDTNKLPNPNRHITQPTTPTGSVSSIFSPSHPSSLGVTHEIHGTLFRLAYTIPSPLPIAATTLPGATDLSIYDTLVSSPMALLPTTPPAGGNVWFVDHPPGVVSPLHRTLSVDLVVQLVGEVELELDGGEKRLLRPGDVTVQRATVHRWRNVSGEGKWARMLAVMVQAEPLRVEGREEVLGEWFEGRG